MLSPISLEASSLVFLHACSANGKGRGVASGKNVYVPLQLRSSFDTPPSRWLREAQGKIPHYVSMASRRFCRRARQVASVNVARSSGVSVRRPSKILGRVGTVSVFGTGQMFSLIPISYESHSQTITIYLQSRSSSISVQTAVLGSCDASRSRLFVVVLQAFFCLQVASKPKSFPFKLGFNIVLLELLQHAQVNHSMQSLKFVSHNHSSRLPRCPQVFNSICQDLCVIYS
ncbi:hypothetical protein B0H19DRAFT_1125582 [Mycena capillaripes]|nr:hypothetical protein B0H19DRAFT_1125582 [Mycena capillaripes]